jgi:hypothetical protein
MGYSKRLSHDFSSSLPSRLGTEVSVQGAHRRCAPAGARDHPAGLRRNGRDDHQRRAVARSRPYVRRNTAARLGQRLRPPRQGALVTQDPAGVRAHPQALLGPTLLGQRGYFSTTSGNITEDIIMRLSRPAYRQGKASAPPHDPTGVSRSVIQTLISRPSSSRSNAKESGRRPQ